MTIREIQTGLREKTFSAKEITESFLHNIREKEPQVHAFLTVTSDLALQQAQEIDSNILKGKEIPELAGVPYSLKDAILAKGVPCTAGSRMLEHYTATYDAKVVENLRNAGAVLLGKTNMDEFGMGASTEYSAFGPTHNPRNLSMVPGGSSGGSAASVAAQECLVSLGEDTGGSVRLPASFCGVVGMKPTYGTVSRSGVIALASSLDQVGPFAETVQDCENVFRVISGKDEQDATSVLYEYGDAVDPMQIEGLTIGVPKEYFAKGLDPDIEKRVREMLGKLANAGANVQEVSLPRTSEALAAYYVINTSEASSNLARYDGIRYGHASGMHLSLQEAFVANREAFGEEVKRRIMLGTFALSAGYYEAYYKAAQRVRDLLRKDFSEAFSKADVLMGPVSPFLPFPLGERVEDPLAMYLVDMYTVAANLSGIPGISVPIGSARDLPVGLQILAPHFKERLLFSVAKTVEQIADTSYHSGV
ncbi:MAG: Asp-tRNA(Asn)/Glu-tRNA(Gln) amidotransferase subunit GatA [bacterium]|nr:Asp-tRNA(Asn)/Glu-tRNA(Gln) amidotransferase subunit GatA [bacterium]